MPENTPFFLSLFLVSTFIGSLTSGLTGFAAGLVFSGANLLVTPLVMQQTS